MLIPFCLTNIGMTPLKYSLDLVSFQRNYPYMHNNGIIRFENTQNNVLPGERKYLRIFYLPKEIKEYTGKFVIKVSDYFRDIQTLSVTFKGTPTLSFESNQLNSYFKVDDQLNGEVGVFTENEDIAYLSDDLIDFRDTDINSITERLMFLHNFSSNKSLKFSFSDLAFSKFVN